MAVWRRSPEVGFSTSGLSSRWKIFTILVRARRGREWVARITFALGAACGRDRRVPSQPPAAIRYPNVGHAAAFNADSLIPILAKTDYAANSVQRLMFGGAPFSIGCLDVPTPKANPRAKLVPRRPV